MKNVILLLSLFFCVPFFAQNIKTEIGNQFRDYNNLIEEKNFEKALDLYANEEFLKIFPKEQLVIFMNQMFNSPEMVVIIHQPENVEINSKVVEEKGQKFVELNYRQKLDMKFNEDVDPQSLLSALQTEFGQDRVKYNETTHFFEINTSKVAVANSSDTKNWKFSVLERKQIPILLRFIPEQFLKDLK